MQNKIQSLTKELAELEEASSQVDIQRKIDVMIELAMISRDSDAHRALKLSEEAHVLSQQEEYEKGIAYSLRNLSVLNSTIFFKLDLALLQANQALALDEIQNNPRLKGNILSSVASVYLALGEYGQSLDYFNQVLEIHERTDNINPLVASISDIGVIYAYTNDYTLALKAFKKAFRLSKEHNIVRMQIIALLNIGEMLIMQNKHSEAKQYLHQAISMCQQHDFHFNEALALGNLAQISVSENDFNQALHLLLKSKDIFSNHSASYHLAEISIKIGEIYQKQGQMEDALSSLQQGLETAVSCGAKKHIMQCHQHIANLYEVQGKWMQALQHCKQFQVLKETLFNKQVDEKIKTFQVIYETKSAKQEAEIYRLKAIELEGTVARRTQRLREAYEELSELDHLKSRFVTDISHKLRAPLTTFSLYLKFLDNGQSTKNKRYIAILNQQTMHLTKITDSITNLSTLDTQKNKHATVEIDLNSIFKQIIIEKQQKSTAHAVSITFEPHAAPVFIYGYHQELTTLAKNLINNALNYTRKGTIVIQIRVDNKSHQGCLKVTDTGIGIVSKDMPHIFERFYRGEGASLSNIPGTGLGLTIAKGIVMLHNGSIDVQSTPDIGTEVQVCLPLTSETDNL